MMQPVESNPISISEAGKGNNLSNKSELHDLWGFLADSLEQRKQNGLFRAVRTVQHLGPTHFELGGNRFVQFGSNDYMGMSCHPEVVQPQNQPSPLRFGSGASQLISGFSTSHDRLVAEIAKFEDEAGAVVFSSGYAANVGTVSALAASQDILFSDSMNHASLIDGCRLSRAQVHIFEHGRMDQLRELVVKNRNRGRFAFIVSDSIFSMEGDLVDLSAVHELCEQFDMHCILDEAHATGVIGQRGQGLVEQIGIRSRRWIRIGTLSKAVGCIGGFVAGNPTMTDWLINFARPGIYSTAIPIPCAMAATRSLQLLSKMEAERNALQQSSLNLRKRIASLGIRVGESMSPIIPVYLPDPASTIRASQKLLQCGLYVPAIRPPTVPMNRCMLRISLSAKHSQTDIDRLVDGLTKL